MRGQSVPGNPSRHERASSTQFGGRACHRASVSSAACAVRSRPPPILVTRLRCATSRLRFAPSKRTAAPGAAWLAVALRADGRLPCRAVHVRSAAHAHARVACACRCVRDRTCATHWLANGFWDARQATLVRARLSAAVVIGLFCVVVWAIWRELKDIHVKISKNMLSFNPQLTQKASSLYLRCEGSDNIRLGPFGLPLHLFASMGLAVEWRAFTVRILLFGSDGDGKQMFTVLPYIIIQFILIICECNAIWNVNNIFSIKIHAYSKKTLCNFQFLLFVSLVHIKYWKHGNIAKHFCL